MCNAIPQVDDVLRDEAVTIPSCSFLALIIATPPTQKTLQMMISIQPLQGILAMMVGCLVEPCELHGKVSNRTFCEESPLNIIVKSTAATLHASLEHCWKNTRRGWLKGKLVARTNNRRIVGNMVILCKLLYFINANRQQHTDNLRNAHLTTNPATKF